MSTTIPVNLPVENSELADAVARKDRAIQLQESVEWQAFLHGVEQRKRQLIAEVVNSQPNESGVHYERILGQVRGLEQVEGILQGIIDAGKQAESRLFELEETPER